MIAKEYSAKIISSLPEEDDVSSHAEEFAAREAQPLMASILEAANEENPNASPEHVKEIAEDVWLNPARVEYYLCSDGEECTINYWLVFVRT